MDEWKAHVFRTGAIYDSFEDAPTPKRVDELRKRIEPWLTAIVQSEHLSLLVGSGLTSAVAAAEGIRAVGMNRVAFSAPDGDKVDAFARETAKAMGRGEYNVEDQLRAALALREGLRILQSPALSTWTTEINSILSTILEGVLATEAAIGEALRSHSSKGMPLLLGFLMSFASRVGTRERLNIATTNYDRLLEHGCDLLGIRALDRFVGYLSPEFRSSRQSVDLHYNPPGIRGEPRYLEGVVRLIKLHGSIDWMFDNGRLYRCPLPFGATGDHTTSTTSPIDRLMIYPNPAKDVETLFFPYAELFRDYASSVCLPNSSLVTYGYGFGDDHINRVIKDMLTVPSTHLVIMSWNDPGNRIYQFVNSVARTAQVSLLIGPHFGDLSVLTEHYLPKPAIDLITMRQTVLLHSRGEEGKNIPSPPPSSGDSQ